jgi:hypothetical protein
MDNSIFLYWALFSLITLWILFRDDYKNYHTRFYDAFDIFILFVISIFFPVGIVVFLSRKTTECLWGLLTKEISFDVFKYYLVPIFNPLYWVRVGKYDKKWDRELNSLMDRYNFKYVDGFTAMLGPHEIWITNHPYGSFYDYNKNRKHYNPEFKSIPSRKTVVRAMAKYKKDTGVK